MYILLSFILCLYCNLFKLYVRSRVVPHSSAQLCGSVLDWFSENRRRSADETQPLMFIGIVLRVETR